GGEGCDFKALYGHLTRELPDYARPVFLRVEREELANTTGTFKFSKMQLVKEGFDPSAVGGDPLYVADTLSGCYVPLDDALYRRIREGEARV
ncbi:MAG: long-chain-acyl-CoA synthetase, partial [Caulobacterales bacterium]|nr:long-chain-acyl-CoA synthetase [Caulobacterales bacterium]